MTRQRNRGSKVIELPLGVTAGIYCPGLGRAVEDCGSDCLGGVCRRISQTTEFTVSRLELEVLVEALKGTGYQSTEAKELAMKRLYGGAKAALAELEDLAEPRSQSGPPSDTIQCRQCKVWVLETFDGLCSGCYIAP